MLTPRESIIKKLYDSYAHPFVRVTGVPALWDSNIAVATSSSTINVAVWSPCNGFVAIGSCGTMRVDILDSATLQRFRSLEFPWELPPLPDTETEALAFSPDSRMLTAFIPGRHYQERNQIVVTWDLQTGGTVSVFERGGFPGIPERNTHVTYSTDGKMVAVSRPAYESSAAISIYDVVSGVYMFDVDPCAGMNPDPVLEALYVYKIWAHGESLRFAAPEPAGITIWEVGFIHEATLTRVETIPIPDDIVETSVFKPRSQSDLAFAEFHPASYRLAFVRTEIWGPLLVWDARASKFLLHHTNVDFHYQMSFSSDGCFFACATAESEVFLWRESPNEYTLFGKLTPGNRFPKPCFSPNGESIITLSATMTQLWHTKGFTTATSSGSAQALRHADQDFVLEFLPDRSSAVAARKKNKTVTVFDLKSGVPQLIIDTSIEVYGLRTVGNSIIVIGNEKAISWNLPEGNPLPDARMNVEASTGSIHFRDNDDDPITAGSVSLDSRYIAVAKNDGEGELLLVYYIPTEQKLVEVVRISALWFGPGEHDICCAGENEAKVFTITEDALNDTKTVPDADYGSWECPWGSSCGYKVTDEGWVLCRDGKRLLMLPPLWRSPLKSRRVWNGKFLALLHSALPELVILELEP